MKMIYLLAIAINLVATQLQAQEPNGILHGQKRKSKGCNSPTISCTLAGGYCFKPRDSTCYGTVDPKGCKGRKCKCCIPDKTTPAPPTCTAVPCTPCPTTEQVITTKGPTPTPTTTTTVSPKLNWISVGADRFVRFNETMHWDDARALCKSHGLDLYIPKDSVALSKYLEENFASMGSDFWIHWLGARGNGDRHVWVSGKVVPDDGPWYSNRNHGINDCMFLLNHSGWYKHNYVWSAYKCTYQSGKCPLCG